MRVKKEKEKMKKRERSKKNRCEIPPDLNVKQPDFKNPLSVGTIPICKGHVFSESYFLPRTFSHMVLCLYIDTSITLITGALCLQKIDGANDTASGIDGAEPDELLNLYMLHKPNTFIWNILVLCDLK